ncbi:hypothetical protein ATN81_19080 [Agrobacterium pusense]|uniref:hypothetical protein n=1 Tax=Agrobacterium pusense TaxID=648995 RepID=UPI00092A6750|nr:hypothetical protein [Agrobacterium pusense]OJH53492.1 hypothetical protein ATN81_19080 [Agrobacterium pusense]OJH57698.1 hypothetical protein BA725_20980 [Agrobacterium pusense]
MTKPTYMIAHGSAAVQAARIIAANAKEREDKARGYELAAQWHDKQEKACREIANDIRVGSHVNLKAAVAATHHGASAAGLRNAASGIRRKSLNEQ